MAKSTNKKNLTEWVSEGKTAELMGIKKRTLQKYVSNGKIPESCISRTINGKRTYHAPTLIGLEN